MLKALVFDFDGVIVDTETQWYYIYLSLIHISEPTRP